MLIPWRLMSHMNHITKFVSCCSHQTNCVQGRSGGQSPTNFFAIGMLSSKQYHYICINRVHSFHQPLHIFPPCNNTVWYSDNTVHYIQTWLHSAATNTIVFISIYHMYTTCASLPGGFVCKAILAYLYKKWPGRYDTHSVFSAEGLQTI